MRITLLERLAQRILPDEIMILLPRRFQKDFSDKLITAAAKGDFREVSRLLYSNVRLNIDTEDDSRRTTLMWASLNGQAGIVTSLLERGANINHVDNAGNTALILASTNGDHEIVMNLLKAGADVNCVNNCGETALSAAERNGHIVVVSFLLAHKRLKKL